MTEQNHLLVGGVSAYWGEKQPSEGLYLTLTDTAGKTHAFLVEPTQVATLARALQKPEKQ